MGVEDGATTSAWSDDDGKAFSDAAAVSLSPWVSRGGGGNCGPSADSAGSWDVFSDGDSPEDLEASST